jgi:hypothetical protein
MLTSRLAAWLGLVLTAAALAIAAGACGLVAAETDAPAKPASAQGEEPIDFERARGLLRRQQDGETLTSDEAAYLQRAREARRAEALRRVPPPADTSALRPLTEMTADDRYQGEDGGLYGGGRNTPPDALAAAARAALGRIRPLNAEGRPDDAGTVALVSLSMSNATQEFSTFKRIADEDPAKWARLTIVDCAQGGQAMAEWAPPDARPWTVARERLQQAGVTPAQVQVAWIKLANKMPQGDLKQHGTKLRDDTAAVIRNAKAAFPNLQIVYLGSRIYAGYATTALNPEPYAYESALVVRWLIRDQADGKGDLNADAARGPVSAPVLLWGPYMWANGATPRKADGLVYLREDLAGDGTHPSTSGRQKVARLLLEFFKSEPLARPWFVGPEARAATP